MNYFPFPEYIPVGERKRRNEKAVARLIKQGKNVLPVTIQGTTIAKTFWGKSWCKNIESYQDYAYRLGRGRSYVRHGSVLDLQITPGLVTALVAGSSPRPYAIKISIAPLPADRWATLRQTCTGRIDSLLSLVQGRLPDEILRAFCHLETGLFPSPREIILRCDCPDSAGLCKHLAAVMYAIGARLDQSPELFFLLRGLDQNELLSTAAIDTLTAAPAELDTADLADTFGIDFDSPDIPSPAKKATAKPKPKKVAAKKTTSKPAAAKPKKPTAKTAAKTKIKSQDSNKKSSVQRTRRV